MKKFLKQKTFWAGVIGIVTGISMLFTDNNAEGVQTIITGLIAIFLRQGIEKNK